MEALALKQQGWQQQPIAQALGVTKGAVSLGVIPFRRVVNVPYTPVFGAIRRIH